MNLFLWEAQAKPCPQEVLGRDWTQAQLQFPCHKWKNSSFSLFRKVLPFECFGGVEFIDISAVKVEPGDSGP